MMMQLLLVTANVGSVFENLNAGLDIWMDEVAKVVQKKRPQFIALHFQETGGKDYKRGSNVIDTFFGELIKRMNAMEFKSVEGFVDSRCELDDQYTALSSLYFVHEEAEEATKIWDFQDEKFVNLEHSTRMHIGNELHKTGKHRIEKFPQNFFPNCKWSRKGFLRTRWRISGRIMEFVNVHLFHDSCNLVAAEESPSSYAKNRERALHYTFEKLGISRVGESSPRVGGAPVFIFGDFNFRLNTQGVLSKLKESSPTDELRLDSKVFSVPEHEAKFKHSYKWLKAYEFEAKKFYPAVQELELDFHPSYPFEEEVGLPETFLKTRCPAWCDRVLFSASGSEIISHDSKPEYNLIGSEACMGDHKIRNNQSKETKEVTTVSVINHVPLSCGRIFTGPKMTTRKSPTIQHHRGHHRLYCM